MDKSITIQAFRIVCPRLKPWAMVKTIFNKTPVDARLHHVSFLTVVSNTFKNT